jgi:SAM-dependent methyltransferase
MKTELDTETLWTITHAIRNRIRRTIAFIDPEDLKGKIADCGETNPMKEGIEKHFNVTIKSHDWNFNFPSLTIYAYNTVLAFEVLEHIYNPLTFLYSVKRMIRPGGVIYLSTPRTWPQWNMIQFHYHEIPTDRLMWLFEEAGLKIVRSGKISLRGDWYHYLWGFRPFLRGFWKTRIYKLKVI